MKRGRRFSLKKWALLVLALSLLAPQLAFAQQEGAVPRWQFGDMNDNHWATKHVSKIGLLGITSGDNLGNYNPSKNITRQEAIIMVINLLGLQDEANANTVAVNLDGYGVSAWAETSVKYAVVKGLIDLREESGGQWGTGPATREWIAKLIVKAIGKEKEAQDRDGEYTGFLDDAMISDGYAGYIRIAKELGIIKGDNNNRFNPTASITRAEMAVIFGQAEQHLAVRNSQIVQGTLDNVGSSTISVRTASGVVSYALAPNAKFYTHDSNNAILPSNLTLGDAIFLIHYGGTAYYIEKTAHSISYETITGEYLNIYTDTSGGQSMRIALLVDGEPRSFPFTPGVTSFTSETGSGMSMSQLTEGSVLELSRVAGTEQITSVVVKSVVERKTLIGTVERIFADSRFVEIKDGTTGERLPLLEVPANVAIQFGAREIGLADLHIGDEVRILLVDGAVEEFEVTDSVVTIVEGKVVSVDAALRLINLHGTPIVGYVAENNAEISIDGLSSPRIRDVQAEDDVLLELNANGRIQRIVVLNRSIDARMGLEFYSFDEKTNTLSYRDGDNLINKKLSADTIIEHQFNKPTLDQINQYFRENDKIDLVFTGDRLVRMSYSKAYTGVIKDISTRTNTITLNADEFGEIQFTYTTPPYVFMFGKSSTSLADVRIGDRVGLELDNQQGRVQYLSIVQKQLYKVKEKLSYKLVVTDSTGKSYDVSTPSSIAITHYDKMHASYADIAVGDYVMVTFTGSQATDIYIPRVSTGTVESVDLAQNTFAFREHGKDVRTIGDNRRVEIDGRVSPSVSALKAGDRIQLVEGEDGVRLIAPLTKEQRKVSRYIANTKVLQLTRSTLDQQSTYELTDDIFLHHKGTAISPTTLKRDDVINLYFHGSKLVEIEKQ